MKINYKIRIDDNVLSYLEKKKRKVITLTINKSGGGCCPTIEVYDIDLNQPSNIEFYNKFEIDDVTVFVNKIARVTAPILRFSLQKSLFVSSIIPSGLSLKGH